MPGREQIQRAIRYSGVKNPFRPCHSPWPKVLGAAAVGGAATLFLARNFFPSEKKIHHEVITDYAVGDDVFVRTMGNLLGPPLLKGNKVTALENGDQIFPALLDGGLDDRCRHWRFRPSHNTRAAPGHKR